MEKEFDLAFNNCILDNEFYKLPEYKGIYLFRVSIRRSNGKCGSTVVYIGKADGENGLKGRITDKHEHLKDARNLVDYANKHGNDAFLTISYSDENSDNEEYLERIESALIYTRKPIINDRSKDSFNYQKTVINISGDRMLDLESRYEVVKTKQS